MLSQTAVTVGDVQTAGEDLTSPAEEAADAGEAAVDARDAVVVAPGGARRRRSRRSPRREAAEQGLEPPEPTAAEPSPVATVPAATVTRVQQAEDEFASARSGITDETPLVQASEQFNAAAVALEMAWLRLFADSGCLSDERRAEASATVSTYTAALQQSLTDAGYCTGPVDGIYGPQTVAAVQAAAEGQRAARDGDGGQGDGRRTARQPSRRRVPKRLGRPRRRRQRCSRRSRWPGTGTVRSTVSGPTSSRLPSVPLQTDLGVPVTGTVDAATVAAFQAALAGCPGLPAPEPTPTESDRARARVTTDG